MSSHFVSEVVLTRMWSHMFFEFARQLVFGDGPGQLIFSPEAEDPSIVPPEMPPQIAVVSISAAEHSLRDLARLQLGRPPVLLIPEQTPHRLLSAEYRTSFGHHTLAQAQFESLLTQVPPGTQVGCLLPSSVLHVPSQASWRHKLFERTSLRAVSFLRAPFLPYENVHPGFSMALVVVIAGEQHSADQEVQFKTLPLDIDWQSPPSVRSCFTDEKYAYSAVIDHGGGPITFERFHPLHQAKRHNVAALGEMQPLANLVEILFAPPMAARATNVAKVSNRIITGRNLVQGNILMDDAMDTQLRRQPTIELKENDICLPRIWNSTNRNTRPVVQITADLLPLQANHTVVVLRPRAELPSEAVEFLIAFLESAVFKEILVAEGAELQLSTSTLRAVDVPIGTQDMHTAVFELNQAVKQLEEWAEEARKARMQLFGQHAGKQARIHILEAGRDVRQRVASGRLITDFGHRVRTRYPLPIAYRWRTVQAAHPDLEGYLHLLECAEAVLTYTALTAIYLANYVKREPLAKVRDIASRFASRSGAGINFGDWRSILEEVNSKKIRKLAATAPFYEVTTFLDNEESKAAIVDLIHARNDQSHGRGPKGADVDSAFTERRESLEALLSGVEFLSEYPLRYIERAQWNSRRRESHVTYRDLIGDHPLTPIGEEIVTADPLEDGSLYLVDREGQYHLIRPLLLRRRCPECGTMATFALDGYDQRTGGCRLKSLEHGHIAITHETEVTEAYREFGLITS